MNIFISAICIINIIKNKKDQEQLLIIIRKKETIIKDIEKQYYSSKLSTIRQNIINAVIISLLNLYNYLSTIINLPTKIIYYKI